MDPNVLRATSINKFNIKGKTLYVQFIWKHDEVDLFHIKIFDGDSTWSGKYNNESVKKYSDCCDETENEYVEHVKRYLEESDHHEVLYDFDINKENSELATFIWKKKFDGGSTIKHGSVSVNLDKTVESKDLLLDILLEENRELRTTIETLNEKNNTVSAELNKYKTELENFVDIKTKLEESLYGKFTQLLNSKKRRIQLLEDNVHKISDSNDVGDDH